jgi:hypothetical protein
VSRERHTAMLDELLQEDLHAELSAVEARFEGFAAGVLARLDEASDPEAARVLRTDEASAEERADAALFEAPELVGAALRAETEAALAEVDFAAFARGVEDGLDAEALAPQVAVALREAAAEAVASREGQWADFTAGVLAALPAATVTVAELLTEATEAELVSRDGEWRAFTARVFEAVDAESRALAREPADAQAVQLLRAEVEDEVEALAPRFDARFGAEVDREIFKAGQAPEPWWKKAWTWLHGALQPGHGLGWAAAAAAVVLLVVSTGLPPGSDPALPDGALAGTVTVEQLSFEGNVTVLPDEGLTVVWLSDVR